MECNKDAAVACFSKAVEYFSAEQYDPALRFFQKATRLDPSVDYALYKPVMRVRTEVLKKKAQGHVVDHYRILEVNECADAATLKKSYRRLALMLHPDKNNLPGAEEAFKVVKESYNTLLDPGTKLAFHSTQSQERRAAHATQQQPTSSAFHRPTTEAPSRRRTAPDPTSDPKARRYQVGCISPACSGLAYVYRFEHQTNPLETVTCQTCGFVFQAQMRTPKPPPTRTYVKKKKAKQAKQTKQKKETAAKTVPTAANEASIFNGGPGPSTAKKSKTKTQKKRPHSDSDDDRPKKRRRIPPDFKPFDFEVFRMLYSIKPEQVWALYDDEGLPRYLAKVLRVPCSEDGMFDVQWLEQTAKEGEIHDGTHTLGELEQQPLGAFAHQMQCDATTLIVRPMKDEVWAVFEQEGKSAFTYGVVDSTYCPTFGVGFRPLTQHKKHHTLFTVDPIDEHRFYTKDVAYLSHRVLVDTKRVPGYYELDGESVASCVGKEATS